MVYKFKELIISFPFKLISIENLSFAFAVSNHSVINISAILPEEEADGYVYQITGETIVKIYEQSKDNIIFYGRVTSMGIRSQGGLHYMDLSAMSSTYLMDVERKSRSFFKKEITYKEIVQAVLKDYPNAKYKYHVKLKRKVDFPIIQYQETDWEFITRIAALFEAVLIPNANTKGPCFSIGVPKHGLASSADIMLVSSNKKLSNCLCDYYDSMLCLSLIEEEDKKYKTEKEKQQAQTNDFLIHELDFVEQTVLGTQYLNVGSVIVVGGSTFFIESGELFSYEECLYYRYNIKIGTAIKTRYHGNPRISGVSLVGTVKKRIGNQVSLNLEIDQDDGYEDEREDYLFTYALETSAYYCMPVRGAKIHLYFPSDREWEAIAVNSLRSTTQGAKKEAVTSNPDNKSLTTSNGQALEITPTGIAVAGNDEQTSVIKLSNDGNITLNGKNFLVIANSIEVGANSTKSLLIQSKDKILFTKVCGAEIDAEHCIGIADVVQLSSKQKIWHYTYGTPQVPSISYDESALIASEKQTALDQNQAIEDTLIARKKEARGKFGKGLLMVTIGTCLVVATAGIASGPVAIAVGTVGTATTIFGEAEMNEGISSYNLAMSGDWTTEAYNPLKEVMGEDFYNATVNGLAITSSLIFAGLTGGAGGALLMLGGAAFSTGVTLAMDVVDNGKIDMKFNDYMNTFAVSSMSFALSGGIVGKFSGLKTLTKLQKFGIKFAQQFTASTMMDIGNGQLNLGENLFRETISSAVSALVGNCALSKVADFATDVGVETAIQGYKAYTTGKPFDYKQVITTAVVSAVSNTLFAHDPIDTVRGRLFVYEEDLEEQDLYGILKFTRRYNSTCTAGLSLGRGWIHEFESFLYGDNQEVSVLCADTHKEVFEKVGDKWINNKNGNCKYTLEQDEVTQRFYFTSYENGKYEQKEFDTHGKLLSIAYHRNKARKTMLYYNEEEELTELVTPGGKTLQFFYEGGYLVRVEDSIGRVVRYEYTDNYLTKVIYPNGGEHTYQYDDRGNLVYANNPTGKDLFINEYDNQNRVIKQTLADGNYGEAYYEKGRSIFYYSSDDRKGIYEYNEDQQVVKITYGDGTTQSFGYDQWGNKNWITGRNGHTIRRVYNDYGQIIREEQPSGLITEYEYNTYQELIKQKDNTGYLMEYSYDEGHTCVAACCHLEDGTVLETRYTYDELGRIVQVIDANDNTITYEYDTENISQANRYITAEGEVFEYTYDEGGRNTEIISEYGSINFTYNSANEITQTIDAYGNVTKREYDKNNNLIRLVLPTGNRDGVEDKGYQFYYDNLERRVKTKNPLGAYHAYVLDGQGNTVKEIHPNAYDEKTGDGVGVTYLYDKGGHRIKEQNALGDTRRYEYDAEGNLIKVIEPEEYARKQEAGKGYCYEYDKNNRLITIKQPNGQVEKRYVYDAKGRLVKEINAKGYQSASTDEERYGTIYTYNAVSWLIEKREPVREEKNNLLYHVTRYVYDKVGNKTEEKRGIDYVTVTEEPRDYHTIYFKYDRCNRLVTVKDKLGAAMEYAYDSLGNKTVERSRINEDTHKTIRYEYNKVGLLEKMIQVVDKCDLGLESNSITNKSFLTTTYQYDGNGNLTQIVTPEGYRIHREYDALDQMILEKVEDKKTGICRVRQYTYDKAGNRIEEMDGLGRTVSYTYDLANRQIKKVDEEGAVTRIFYDKNGRVKKVVHPDQYDPSKDDGAGTTYDYDDAGRLIETRNALGILVERNTYNSLGKLERKEDSIGLLAKYKYDIRGLVETVATKSREREGEYSQSYTYDAAGHITGICDGEGHETRYELDEWGRITTIHKPDKTTEQFTYDYAGNIEKATDGNGNMITYRYNSFNQLKEIIDQTGERETFAYDKQGRRNRHNRKNGTYVRYEYNVDNKLVRRSGYSYKQNGKDRSKAIDTPQLEDNYIYNTEGQLMQAIGGGIVYHYDYTPSGRVKSKKVNHHQVLQYIYTKSGKVSRIKDLTGKETCYEYDAIGRTVRISEAGHTLADYTYTPDNSIQSIQFANGICTEYTYNEDRNYASLVTKTKGGEELLSYTYQYDKNGNRTKITNMLTGGQAVGEISYTYDSMQRLSTIQYPNAVAEQYTYDNAGNRVLKRCGELESRYTYNSRNQLVHSKVYDTDNTYRENTYRKNTYTYDLQGNLIKEEMVGVLSEQKSVSIEEKSYEYDGFNRLSRVDIQRGEENDTQKNFYDCEGLRSAVEENGEITNFITNGWSIVAELDQEYNVKRRIIRGYGIVASDEFSNEVSGVLSGELPLKDSNHYRYYHTNEHTDVVLLTNAEGKVVNEYEYDAFGNYRSIREQEPNRYGYTSEVYDNLTEQYYLRARYYNPTIARFTQEDEYRGDGLNLYAYCENNPVMYADPSGYKKGSGCGGTGVEGESGSKTQVYDIVEYGDKTPGLENHHGVLDVWATNNIDGYKSRASKSTTIALTPEQHAATKSVYRDWLYERTGKKVGGKVDWTSVSPQEVQALSERMFDAANVPLSARNDYYREFNRYIYGLGN